MTEESKQICAELVREKIRYYTQLILETKRAKLKNQTIYHQQPDDVYDKIVEVNLAKVAVYENVLKDMDE